MKYPAQETFRGMGKCESVMHSSDCHRKKDIMEQMSGPPVAIYTRTVHKCLHSAPHPTTHTAARVGWGVVKDAL